MIVAIDGPAGSGKSSTARALASRLGFIYMDTGAMYRAVALRFLKLGLEVEGENVEKVLENLDLDLCSTEEGLRVILNEEDVSEDIRTPLVTDLSSRVSTFPAIRSRMVDEQRRIANEKVGAGHHLIVEGRDIGTVVFPSAEVKIFLEASAIERARRRIAEFQERGIAVDMRSTERDLLDRDHRDRTRELSPLVCADDAIQIDTTELTLEEQIDAIENIIRERM